MKKKTTFDTNVQNFFQVIHYFCFHSYSFYIQSSIIHFTCKMTMYNTFYCQPLNRIHVPLFIFRRIIQTIFVIINYYKFLPPIQYNKYNQYWKTSKSFCQKLYEKVPNVIFPTVGSQVKHIFPRKSLSTLFPQNTQLKLTLRHLYQTIFFFQFGKMILPITHHARFDIFSYLKAIKGTK